jgi:hypothetical protein
MKYQPMLSGSNDFHQILREKPHSSGWGGIASAIRQPISLPLFIQPKKISWPLHSNNRYLILKKIASLVVENKHSHHCVVAVCSTDG